MLMSHTVILTLDDMFIYYHKQEHCTVILFKVNSTYTILLL